MSEDADGIGEADLGDAVAEIGVVAVSRVGQCDLGVDPGGNGRTQLVQCDLWLGLEGDIFGYASSRASGGIINPLVRQIQAISERQAGVIVGRRKAHRDLTDRMFVAKRWPVPRYATSEGCAGWASAEPHA